MDWKLIEKNSDKKKKFPAMYLSYCKINKSTKVIPSKLLSQKVNGFCMDTKIV